MRSCDIGSESRFMRKMALKLTKIWKIVNNLDHTGSRLGDPINGPIMPNLNCFKIQNSEVNSIEIQRSLTLAKAW